MGGRTKPKWIVYEDGPLHGERRIVGTDPAPGRFVITRASATPGMLAQLEYDMTAEVRRGEKDGGMKLATAQVARFVRHLPDVPAPPPAPMVVLPCPSVPMGRSRPASSIAP